MTTKLPLPKSDGNLAPQLRPITWKDRLRYTLALPWNWIYSVVHTGYETLVVVFFIKTLKAGLLDKSHPWVTGISPHTGQSIWTDNLVYASPNRSKYGLTPDDDEQIVHKVGKFLSNMVRKSTEADPEINQGPKRRMPHGVNYLHGTVHFNGGFVLFDNFADAVYHFTDPAFIQEIRRFACEEKRELILVFRERRYDPEEYAWCLTCVRAHLRWYANANGPNKQAVLFGTPSPYAAINPINGSWATDVNHLRKGRMEQLCRPPISKPYFKVHYQGYRFHYNWIERYHAWSIYWQIKLRGFQGPLVFTPRRRIEPRRFEAFKKIGWWKWQSVTKISNPFFQSKSEQDAL
ncbi:MAG: hypothetical protein AAGG75_16720 [Bacteroidota bacterium]